MPTATMVYGLGSSDLNGRVTFGYQGIEILGRLELTGAQTYDVDLAWVPTEGLKGLLISVDSVDADGVVVEAPITLTWTSNATSKSEELSPGGAFLLASPTPTNGITALSIESTANAVLHIAALG